MKEFWGNLKVWQKALIGLIAIGIVANIVSPNSGSTSATEKPVAEQPKQPAAAQPSGPVWVDVRGSIEKGVTVYVKKDKSDQDPEPWFTVLEPAIEGADGVVRMKVKYEATGKEELIERRATLESPAGKGGLLVRKG